MQFITRKGSFDSAHRVMNEKMKCFNIHGHTYLYELTFQFNTMQSIGYAIDFKEIKRIACQWIDDKLDHGVILNPSDSALIHLSNALDSKLWIMSLHHEYCNPTVENIAREIFIAMKYLFEEVDGLVIYQIRLWETPNCYTDCFADSIPQDELYSFSEARGTQLKKYAREKGVVEYDDRKSK